MAYKPIDSRQIVNRAILQQLFPYVGAQTLDVLLASINADLTSPLSTTATSTPSLVVNVGPAIVSNSESHRNHSIPFVNNVLPTFTSGTVTFPSTSGGNIVASPGGGTPLTLPSGDYAQVLLSLDSSGNIEVNVGVPNSVEADATAPTPIANTLPFAYVTLFNSAGTIQNVTQNNIYQLALGGSSSGSSSSSTWVAKEIGLTNGTTSQAVTFSTPQPDLSYVVLGMMGNTVDAFPQHQQIEVTSKSTSGFVFTWNHPIDSGNYFISFIVPPKTLTTAEASIGSGANTLSTTLPIAQSNSTYGVVSELQNTTDANPQFQTMVVGSNSSTTLNLSWNVATDTANYLATYVIAATGQVAVSSGVTSITVPLPVSYGTPDYAAIASMQNTVDAHPQFQPLLITGQTANSITFGVNVPTDTANYLLNYYVLSLTP